MKGRHQTLFEGVSHIRSARTGKCGPSVSAVMAWLRRARSMHSCTPYRTAPTITAGNAQRGASLHLDAIVLRLQVGPGGVQPGRDIPLIGMSPDGWPYTTQLFDPACQLVGGGPNAWTGIARDSDRIDHWHLHVCVYLLRFSLQLKWSTGRVVLSGCVRPLSADHSTPGTEVILKDCYIGVLARFQAALAVIHAHNAGWRQACHTTGLYRWNTDGVHQNRYHLVQHCGAARKRGPIKQHANAVVHPKFETPIRRRAPSGRPSPLLTFNTRKCQTGASQNGGELSYTSGSTKAMVSSQSGFRQN